MRWSDMIFVTSCPARFTLRSYSKFTTDNCPAEHLFLTFDARTGSQSEQTLFENGIVLVPEGQCEADHLMAIANAGQAILRPAISTRTCVVVREIFPRVPVSTVVLADGPPGTFGKIRSPALPVLLSVP